MSSLRVLYVTSEMFPLAHTGGLGDVGAALPAALRELEADVRVMLPLYPSVAKKARHLGKPMPLGSLAGAPEAALIAATAPETGVPLLLVDCPPLFQRPGGLYADERGRPWPDNAQRFALLSHAAAAVAGLASPLPWSPQIVHANDWQTGLSLALLAMRREGRPSTVFTIHNLSFLGLFPYEVFPELGLPAHAFNIHGVEFYGDVSFMKAGIYYADRIVAVSPTYAREIQTPEFGAGLEGLLAGRSDQLSGILNGADYARWDPANDAHLAVRYAPPTLEGKSTCKAALQRELGLDVRPDAFLLGCVSRLTSQKGLDLLYSALPMLDRGDQIALLASGDRALERTWLEAAERRPDRIGVRIGFDEGLAHRIEAGADAFVMPSRFEPCGLNQMYSLRYGTPPIVHRVGGLADTVDDGVTGFVFDEPRAAVLAETIRRARANFADQRAWRAIQLRGMAKDFSWQRSAREYVALYKTLVRA